MCSMAHDWHEWHRAYDQPESPLARRLVVVQECITAAIDTTPPGPVGIVSMCAGEGRDVLGVLASHPRRADVHGRLVELDEELAATARSYAPAGIEVLCADAGAMSSYAGAVPADVVLVCGVFGNVTDADMMHTIDELATLCAPRATVIWTRHRRAPDATPAVRRRFSANGFDEVGFYAPENTMFAVGMHRLVRETRPFDADGRLFDFVGYGALDSEVCQCGFSYAMGRSEITPWLRSDTRAFLEKFGRVDPSTVRTRPEPIVWSPLEYACHVRDVLRVQTDRVDLAQRELEPTFVPMRRDERVVEDRYNEQDPAAVASEIAQAADAFVSALEGLDENGWMRTGVYNYPQPSLRTVEWIAIHTDHELLHHRGDI
jgi:hypothetical protein